MIDRIDWISKYWGVVPCYAFANKKRRRWAVVYGDNEWHAWSGVYRTRRRAKKEIVRNILGNTPV